MSRRTIATDYLQPIKSDGTLAAAGGDSTVPGAVNRGVFTMAVATYYVPFGGADAKAASLMAQWDGTAVITSITIEETDAPEDVVSNYAASAGNWFSVADARLTSTVNGAGTSANTNDVIAHSAAGAGGSIQTVQDNGARRLRAAIVVATGGEMRFYTWGQD